MTKPGVLDLLKAVLWAENQGSNTVPDELYYAIRNHVAKSADVDRGRAYLLGKPIFEAIAFVKEPDRQPSPLAKGTA